MSGDANLHASAAIVGGFGLLVTGPSGSGKTQLCLALVESCQSRGLFGIMVADDQVLLRVRSGRLIARVPATIAGLAELRGLGPAPAAHLPEMIVDRLVRLVPCEAAQRLPDSASEDVAGVVLPRLDLAANGGRAARLALLGWLGLAPFAG